MTPINDPEIDTHAVLLAFLLFCRIGSCLMIMPGFSSARIPARVRLFIALSSTLALAPVLMPLARAAFPKLDMTAMTPVIISEMLVGVVIGLMARYFFLALQFTGVAISNFIGLAGMPGSPIEETDPASALTTMITLTAATLLFVTDQHWEILRALTASYAAMPMSELFSPQRSLIQLTDVLTDAFIITLQLSSPFLIYSILINFLFGLVNKLVPSIPVFFISVPFIVGGGFFLLYFLIHELLDLFMTAFSAWLAKG